MKYAIETFALNKTFSDCWGRSKVLAVRDLDLKVHYNEVFGLLGPNGSGKTTAIKTLLGLLHPTSGTASVLGGKPDDPKINARIGFMPEESYLYKYLNARETLDFYGKLFSLSRKVRKMRTESLLDMVGLKAVANRPVGTYSKGMARRIGLAQALINDPDLLILDEPTTGLDPIGTRQIKDLIVKLAQRNKTILLCSHLLADVEDVCDTIAILYGGKIQTVGQVKQLLLKTDKKQITTGAISDSTLRRVEELIRKETTDLDISVPMEKLETFFVKTVTEAQKARQTTSGAVSTTQIGEFLSKQTVEDNILDKLVSSQTADTEKPRQKDTQKPSQTQTAESPRPDSHILTELTREQPGSEKPGIELTPHTQKPENKHETTEETENKENKKILDRLTSDSQKNNTPVQRDPDNSDQGESENG